MVRNEWGDTARALTMVSGMLAVIIVIISPLCVRVCVCMCSVMSDSVAPWTVSPPGSSAHGTFQARILESGAISYSRGSSQPRDQTSLESPALAGKLFTTGASWEAQYFIIINRSFVWILGSENNSFQAVSTFLIQCPNGITTAPWGRLHFSYRCCCSIEI